MGLRVEETQETKEPGSAAVLLATTVAGGAHGALLVAVVARSATEIRQGSTAVDRLEDAHEGALEVATQHLVSEGRLSGRRSTPRDQRHRVASVTRTHQCASQALRGDVALHRRATELGLDAVDARVVGSTDGTRDLAGREVLTGGEGVTDQGGNGFVRHGILFSLLWLD